MKKVLIGYYSKTGTTRKVCELMSSVLESAHYQIDLMQLSQITELDPYDTVVIAAPINGMRWVEQAKTFVDANAEVLRDKEVIVIYISYIIRTGSRFWQNKIKKGIESLTKPIRPMVIKDFGGVVGEEFPAFARKLFGITKGTSLDMSDDQEVKIFAEEMINRLS